MSVPLSKITWPYKCGSIFGLSSDALNYMSVFTSITLSWLVLLSILDPLHFQILKLACQFLKKKEPLEFWLGSNRLHILIWGICIPYQYWVLWFMNISLHLFRSPIISLFFCNFQCTCLLQVSLNLFLSIFVFDVILSEILKFYFPFLLKNRSALNFYIDGIVGSYWFYCWLIQSQLKSQQAFFFSFFFRNWQTDSKIYVEM